MIKAVWVVTIGCFVSLLPAQLKAGIDAPGSLQLDFLANHDLIYPDYESLPDDDQFDALRTHAYLFSNASSFGQGVLIWASFALVGPQGPRYGTLYLDLDLTRAPRDDSTAMPKSAVRAQYLEKTGDQILFDGTPLIGDVWILDIVFHADDRGGLEGEFAFVFVDTAREPTGSRALIRGRFITDPSPVQLRQEYGVDSDFGDDYVAVDCSGAVVVDADEEASGCEGDHGGGCGGDDESASGCDGDTSGEAGCEGDTQGSDCQGGGGGDCAGDAGGGSCSGGGADCAQKAKAAVARPAKKRSPISAFSRFFPELSVLAFILWYRRRAR